MDYQYLRYLTILQTYGTPLLALIARFPGPLHGLSIWFMWKTADLSLMCCTRRLKTKKGAIDEAACSQIAVSEHTDGKFNGKEETWGEKRCMTVEITSTLRVL